MAGITCHPIDLGITQPINVKLLNRRPDGLVERDALGSFSSIVASNRAVVLNLLYISNQLLSTNVIHIVRTLVILIHYSAI